MSNIKEVNDVPSNINELCRLCLSKDSGILPIFDEEENGNNSVPLAFRILACVSIEVSMSDVLPKHICQNCLSQVNSWHIFKQVCDSSQITLKEWMIRLEQGQIVQDKTVAVKEEPPDDVDMIQIHHDSYPRGNTDLLEIKQEEIEVYELGEEEEEEEEEDFNVQVVDDPLSFTPADALRPFPVRSIKSEPIDAELLEEDYIIEISKDGEDSYSEIAQNFTSIDNTCSELGKVVKAETGAVRKKPRRRRPLTLRKRKTPVNYDETSMEQTVITESKQKYYCFPGANGKQHYFCIPCGRTFQWKSYYMRHEKTHRKSRHVCSLCDRHYSCKSTLDRHYRLHTVQADHFQNRVFQTTQSHDLELPKPEAPKLEVEDVKDSKISDSFPCYICRQTFDNHHQLQQHRRTHAEFRCRKCNKTFSGGISLSNHLRTHNFDGFKRYSCKICKKNFSMSLHW
ncbi:hypothetical protein L9F63_000371 [Diploptera punctata]|uniref:Uncharacterized protein n=1 Tax=Diploptera punctata TaxID=6984 RepID=A0AAD8ETF2_DIPPU|nr:hypothetical protein L9F63_000371 [Diploptera punctata]